MENDKSLLVLKGDGIGTEIIEAALLILEDILNLAGENFIYQVAPIGFEAYEICGNCYPKETQRKVRDAKYVLFGAVGDPAADQLPGILRPEKALLDMRKDLELYANVRITAFFPEHNEIRPVKKSVDAPYYQILVREFGQGIYYGKRELEQDYARDEMFYDRRRIEQIALFSKNMAKKQEQRLTLVDKANVLSTSKLWRSVFDKEMKEEKIEYQKLYVDFAAAQCVLELEQMGIIVTENMFGDILADEIAAISGSLGMGASYSVGERGQFFYEPIHGSAPTLKGTGKANPTATFISASYYLEHGYQRKDLQQLMMQSVAEFYKEHTTFDLQNGKECCSLSQMTTWVRHHIKEQYKKNVSRETVK